MRKTVSKGLRRLAEGDQKKYKALKRSYKEYKFDYRSKELPF